MKYMNISTLCCWRRTWHLILIFKKHYFNKAKFLVFMLGKNIFYVLDMVSHWSQFWTKNKYSESRRINQFSTASPFSWTHWVKHLQIVISERCVQIRQISPCWHNVKKFGHFERVSISTRQFFAPFLAN